ncbi:unnamed protein product [Closterium sp. NIES-54]
MQHLWLSQTAVLLRLWYRDLLAKCQEAAKSVRAAVAATAAAGASASAGSGGGGSGAIQGQIGRIGRFGRGIGNQIGDQLRKVHLGGRRRWLFLSVFILASATMQMSWPVRQQGKRHAATALPASSLLAVQQRGSGDDSSGDARMMGDDDMSFADSRDWTSQRRRGGRAESAWGAADREWGGKGGTEGQGEKGENVSSRVGTKDWVGGLVGDGRVSVSEGGLGANGTVGGWTNRSADGADVLLGRSADGQLGGKGTPTGGGELGGEVGRGGAGGAGGVAGGSGKWGESGEKRGAGGEGSGAGKGVGAEGKVGMEGGGGSRGGGGGGRGAKEELVEGGIAERSIGGKAGEGEAGGSEAGNKSFSEGEARSYGYWRAGGKEGEAGSLDRERRGGSLEGAGGIGGDGRRVYVRERYEREGRDKVAGRGWWGWGRGSWSGGGQKGERRGEKESGRGEEMEGGSRSGEERGRKGGEEGRAWRDGSAEGSREAWARREREGEGREAVEKKGGESAGGESGGTREAGLQREKGSRGSEGSNGGTASGRGPPGRDGLSHGVTQGPPEGGGTYTQGAAEEGRLERDSRIGELGGPRDERELWEQWQRDQGGHGLGGVGQETGGGFSARARPGPGTYVESKGRAHGVSGNDSSAHDQGGGIGEAAPAGPVAPVVGLGGWKEGESGIAGGVKAGELQGGTEARGGKGGVGGGGADEGPGRGAGSDSVRGSIIGIVGGGGGRGGGAGGAGGVVEGAASGEALSGASVQPDVHVVAEGLLPNRLRAVCVAHALTRASGLSVRLHWRQHMLLPPTATRTTTHPGTLTATATGTGTGTGVEPGGGAGTGAGAGAGGVGGVGAGFVAAAFGDLLMPLPGMTVDVREEVVVMPGEQGKAGFAGADAQAGAGGFKPHAGFVLQKLPMEAPACGPAPFHQRQHGPILLYLSSLAAHSHHLQECIQGIINATSACQLAAPLKTCYSQLAPAAPVEQLMANENMTRVRESTGVYFEGPTSSPVLYGGFLCPAPWVLNCSLHRLLHRMLHTPSATFTTASFFPSFSTVLSRALHPSRLPILLAASAHRYTLCSFFRPPSLPIRPPQPSMSEWNERRRRRQQQEEGYLGEDGMVGTQMEGGGWGGGGGSMAGGRRGVAVDLGLSAVEKQRAASGFASPANTTTRTTAGARRRLLQAKAQPGAGGSARAGKKPGVLLGGGAAGAGRKGKTYPLDVARQCDQLWLAELFTLGRTRALLHLARSIESDFITSQAAAAEAAERLEAEANAVLAGIDVFLALYHNEGGDGHGGSGAAGGPGELGVHSPTLSFPPILSPSLHSPWHLPERLNAMYCFIPKVACTSWKVWFRTYHRLPNPASVDWAHAPGANGLPELWFAYDEAAALRALSDRRLFRFVFLRDPFVRVASAYLDKHVAGSVGSKGRRASGSEERILKGRQQWNMLFFGRVPKLLAQLANPVSHLLSFRDFVYLIERVPKDWLEPHIAPQARLCGLHHIKYDFVGRLESLERDAATVLHHLGDLPSYNLFSSPTSAASLVDADAAADPATLALAMSAAASAAGAAGSKAQLGVGQFHVTDAASKLLELYDKHASLMDFRLHSTIPRDAFHTSSHSPPTFLLTYPPTLHLLSDSPTLLFLPPTCRKTERG